jgi:hypothetical protein
MPAFEHVRESVAASKSRAASFDGAQDEGEYSIHFLILSLSKDEEALDAEFLHTFLRGHDDLLIVRASL